MGIAPWVNRSYNPDGYGGWPTQIYVDNMTYVILDTQTKTYITDGQTVAIGSSRSNYTAYDCITVGTNGSLLSIILKDIVLSKKPFIENYTNIIKFTKKKQENKILKPEQTLNKGV